MRNVYKVTVGLISALFCVLWFGACTPAPSPGRAVESVAITTAPDQTRYTEGERFDVTGMVVTATFADGAAEVVSDYKYGPKTPLKKENRMIAVTYGGKSATQNISVFPVGYVEPDDPIEPDDPVEPDDPEAVTGLTGIKITKQPDRTVYIPGQGFNPYGMVVTAEFKDEDDEIVTDYTFSPTGPLKATDSEITVSYGEKNATVSVTFDTTFTSMDFDESVCTFYDKFDGTALDLSKWAFHEGDGSVYGIPGWGNEEEQYYTRDNAAVADGKLTITAKREDRDGQSYTSAKLVTFDSDSGQETFSQTYGKFEARIRLTKAIEGMWPAFWMMPVENAYGGWARSGEIDIMEMKGRFPSNASSALHFADGWPNNKYVVNEYTFKDGGTLTEWHIYGVEWEPGQITFTVDGEPHVTFTNEDWWVNGVANPNAPFDKPFYLNLNLAVGGKFDEKRTPPDNEMPVAMEVDFVRAYAYTP